MRNVFSRRDFLKASAAAVLAASAAGVLTGCDGGGSEIPSATIGLGELDRKSTRLNSSHVKRSRMPSSD